MNENWKSSIKKCIQLFGTNLTSAIIYSAQKQTNLNSYSEIEIKVNNGVIKPGGFNIRIGKKIPKKFFSVLKNINKPSKNCLDFDFIYKQNVVQEPSDGVYADAIRNEDHFVFCFKIQKDNDKAILFGNILPISYYYNSTRKKTEVASLIIELEVFDCINDLKSHNQRNKSLILELIEKQKLNEFLINPSTKYEDDSVIQFKENMTTLDLSAIKNAGSKFKKKF